LLVAAVHARESARVTSATYKHAPGTIGSSYAQEPTQYNTLTPYRCACTVIGLCALPMGIRRVTFVPSLPKSSVIATTSPCCLSLHSLQSILRPMCNTKLLHCPSMTRNNISSLFRWLYTNVGVPMNRGLCRLPTSVQPHFKVSIARLLRLRGR